MADEPVTGSSAFDRAQVADAIVHDLNNLLAGIGGCADQISLALPPTDPARRDVNDIATAVSEASLLVRLSSERSWRGRPVPVDVDLNDVAQVAVRLVGKLVPPRWRVRAERFRPDEYAFVDPTLVLRTLLGIGEWLGEEPVERGVVVFSLHHRDGVYALRAELEGHCPGSPPEALLKLASEFGSLESAPEDRGWDLVVPRSDATSSNPSGADAEAKRVLVYEPDGLLRSFLVSSLDAERIEAASDLSSALRIVEAHGRDFQLVIACADHADNAHLELYRRLRESDDALPFVFVTGQEQSGAALGYVVQDDARAVLVKKPFGVTHLKSVIGALMETVRTMSDGPELGD